MVCGISVLSPFHCLQKLSCIAILSIVKYGKDFHENSDSFQTITNVTEKNYDYFPVETLCAQS